VREIIDLVGWACEYIAPLNKYLAAMTMTKTYDLAPLDGLRGIAITAVFIFHIATAGAFRGTPLLHEIMLAGWLGVDLFFAISGFLITRSALTLVGHPNYYSTFYKNRARRILPAYFSTLTILIIAFNVFYHDSESLDLFNDRIPCLILMCTNMETALTSTATPFGVNHFWSLAIEVQIYLFWPIIVSSLSRRNLTIFAVGLALFSFGYRVCTMLSTGNWIFTYFSTVTRLDSFAMGAAVFLVSENSRRRIISYTLILIGIFGEAITALINSGIQYNKEWSNVFGITFAAFLSSGIVLAVVTGSTRKISQAFTSKYLVGLGIVSYSFYVLHFPIMGSRWFGLTEKNWKTFGQSIQQDMVMTVVLFTTCLCAAVLSYYVFEKPFFRKKQTRKN
jgi:peptidoglycan/LPS O-acetylase OafA/YrhL